MRISLLALVFLIVSCGAEGKKDMAKKSEARSISELEWMLGKWIREDNGQIEMWSKKEDSFFGGILVEVDEEGKTEIKEVLSLEGNADGVFYGAKVQGQNNNKKVVFKMSNTNFDTPKFSNESHDFPNHISYMKIGKDKIKVEVTGSGGEGSTFYYVREM